MRNLPTQATPRTALSVITKETAPKRGEPDFISKRHYRKSHKEAMLDKELRKLAGTGHLERVISALIDDTLIGSIQNYANVVSIRRLGYNDHGPVHARIVT